MEYSDIVNHEQPWYGVKSVFYDTQNELYEERTILVRSTSLDGAMRKGRKEAEQYAQQVDMTYTGYTEAFHIFELELEEGIEVYSTMRRSDLTAKEYIKKFLDTGKEVGASNEREGRVSS